jgi:outer membrane receptor for ferrienterochelin and colicin
LGQSGLIYLSDPDQLKAGRQTVGFEIMFINNVIRQKLILVLLSAPVLVISSTAMAQDVEIEALVMEEVFVTAQKMEQLEQEVPISIKTISSQTLEMINAERFEDMARLVPSLSFTDRQRGQNQVLVRGLGTVNGVSTVAIYNDGVVSATRITGNGSFGEVDPTFYDVDRVEVLRGPQGTLYGEGSFGGVINILSRKPDASGFDGSASVTWRDVEEGTSSNYDYAAMLNIPLISDKLAFRVVGSYVDHDGYVDKIDTITFETSENINTEETTSWRAMLGYSGGGIFSADLIYKYQEILLGGSNARCPRRQRLQQFLVLLQMNTSSLQPVIPTAPAKQRNSC